MAGVAEDLMVVEDLLGDVLRLADVQVVAATRAGLELVAAHRRPPPLAADLRHRRGVAGPHRIRRSLARLGHEPVGGDRDRLRPVPALGKRPAVQVGKRAIRAGCPPMIAIASGRPRRPARANRRRVATDGDPDGDRTLRGLRPDRHVAQTGAVPACHVTGSPSRRARSNSSFSANSSS